MGSITLPYDLSDRQGGVDEGSLLLTVVKDGHTTDEIEDDKTLGAVFRGAEPVQFLGSGVTNVGDFNGDGFDDFALGAPFASPEGRGVAGEVFVIYGGPNDDWLQFPISAFREIDGLRIFGAAAGDFLGFQMDAAGDVDGDGLADLALTNDAGAA